MFLKVKKKKEKEKHERLGHTVSYGRLSLPFLSSGHFLFLVLPKLCQFHYNFKCEICISRTLNFDSPKWSQAVTALPLGEVNTLSAFFSSLNHILQKQTSVFPCDGKYMSPDLTSSMRKKNDLPLSFLLEKVGPKDRCFWWKK